MFFKLICATSWCLFTGLTVYLVLNKPMGLVPLAQVWQSCRATFILQMNKLRVKTLKMEKQPWILLHACCSSLVAFCLLFTTNKWGQTPTPFVFWCECAPVSPTATVCALCCLPLPLLIFCPHFLLLYASLGHHPSGFFFWLFSPVYSGIFYFLLANPPGLFAPCFRIVFESGEKNQTSWVLEGLVLYFRNRMEINGKATQSVEWTEAEREELPQHQVCRCLMFCIAGKLRKVPCGMKHCSLLLLPTHHLPLKPLHFVILCVPCPVNANEVVVQTADRHLFSANVLRPFQTSGCALHTPAEPALCVLPFGTPRQDSCCQLCLIFLASIPFCFQENDEFMSGSVILMSAPLREIAL